MHMYGPCGMYDPFRALVEFPAVKISTEMAADRFLLVAAILEGRHFPKRAQRRLVVEARFNDESLATDPVYHETTPDINTELAWEITGRELKHHRLQRTPIKLQFYAHDIGSTSREMVGYVMLDLRSVHKGPPTVAKWYALLNSTYAKMKPEVKIRLSLESDSGPPPVESKSKPENELREQKDDLVLMLNEDEGCFQLGEKSDLDRTFLLSLTITEANNLIQLVSPDVRLDPKSPYQFSFNLLGNQIANKPFLDLIRPEFSIEKAMLRIRAQTEPLLAFVSTQPDIEINFIRDGETLAVARIPFKTLSMQSGWCIENSYSLIPHPGNVRGRNVGSVGVVLRLELEQEENYNSCNQEEEEEEEEVAPPPLLNSSKATEYLLDITPPNMDHITPLKSNPEPALISTPHEIPSVEQIGDYVDPERDIGVAVDTLWHQFSFSIDLKSVKIFDVSKVGTVARIYLSYSYPFFGSPAPIMTRPAVEVQRHVEKRLPRSFCSFDFASLSQQLENQLEKVPLDVEVWHKDKHSKDILLGVSRIWLSNVSKEERHALTPNGRTIGWKQTHSAAYRISAGEGTSSGSKVGELKVALVLEDHGPVPPQVAESLKARYGSSEYPAENTEPQQAVVPQEEQRQIVIRQDGHEHRDIGRGGPEYEAALELEVWKDAEERKFAESLKSKEAAHMKALASEWKRREKEREMLVQKRVDEYKKLEDKLKEALRDIEKRNRELASSEQQLHQGWAALQQEREKSERLELDAERRAKELYEHHLEIERSKIRDLEEQRKRLLAQNSEWERRYDAKVEEFSAYRSQQSNRPEVHLQADINVLKLEKAELERKVDALTKSKLHYKQQWGRALKELSVLKQQEQADARARLLRQQRELEHMRLRYLAHEEKEMMRSERQEFVDIKQEVEKLKEAREREKRQPEEELERREREKVRRVDDTVPDVSEVDDRVARLIEERDTLLQTGVYTHDDRIIKELDRQIRESLALKGKIT